MVTHEELIAALQYHFGFDTFKGDQEQIIESILDGNDTFVIMPTGGGKSLCFQIPALMLEGTAVVISPLISLMKDQVNALTQNGISAAYLNSSLTIAQYSKAIDNIKRGIYKIVYVAPEMSAIEGYIFKHRRPLGRPFQGPWKQVHRQSLSR